MTQNGDNSKRECWCGCGRISKGEFVQGHDARALYAALELLGYGEKGAICELLKTNGFQPGGARSYELQVMVARRYGSL